MTRSTAALAIAILLALSSGPVCAGDDPFTFTFDFQTGFDGWQQQWHKESTSGTDGVVTHSTERGYLDGASLKFDMGDGFGDDGTLWIEKQFLVPAGQPTPVSISFHLFNQFQSDFNTFEVKAAISTNNPNVQADFTTIGSTDSAEGWVPFSFQDTVTSPTGEVWFAAGIRVAWETPRVYGIDHVIVSTGVPEPASSALAAVGFAGVVSILRRRMTRRLSPASSRPAGGGRVAETPATAIPSPLANG